MMESSYFLIFISVWLFSPGRTTEAETFLTQGAEVIIRMRGLPYDCTASQIVSLSNCQ